MSKFKKKGKGGLPTVNTSALPDLVFTLLFFFMCVTTLRETEQLVTVRIPSASEAVKMERKDLTSYIYVGAPISGLQGRYGTDSRIQLNDSFKDIVDIRDFIAAERDMKSEADRPFMTTALKVDEDVRMGIISDIKQELRRLSALRINYIARRPN